MLWSIFVTYIITHHGLGGFSGFINGLIAAAFGALSMLMSEPTVKSNVKRTCMFVLLITTLHIYTLHITTELCYELFNSDVPIDAPKCKVKDNTYKQGQSMEVLQDYDDKQLAECHQCTCMDGKLEKCHRIYYCELNKPGCTSFIKSAGQCCPTCARGTWLIEYVSRYKNIFF